MAGLCFILVCAIQKHELHKRLPMMIRNSLERDYEKGGVRVALGACSVLWMKYKTEYLPSDELYFIPNLGMSLNYMPETDNIVI